jgi:hypothetical protein
MNLSDNHKKILFVDDTSAMVSNPNFTDFEKVIHTIFKNTNERFSSNLLSQNLGKTHFMQFITKHSTRNIMHINYKNTIILNTSTLKLLGITTDNTLSWKSHIYTHTHDYIQIKPSLLYGEGG